MPQLGFDASGGRVSRVPIDGYVKLGRAFYRAPIRLVGINRSILAATETRYRCGTGE